jgi:hypothetical protein
MTHDVLVSIVLIDQPIKSADDPMNPAHSQDQNELFPDIRTCPGPNRSFWREGGGASRIPAAVDNSVDDSKLFTGCG